MKKEMLVKNVNWILRITHDAQRTTTVQIRSTHTAAAAQIELLKDGIVRVTFEKPQIMVTPSQAAVFYDGDEVLGGWWIV